MGPGAAQLGGDFALVLVAPQITQAPELLQRAWAECLRQQARTGEAVSYKRMAAIAQLTPKTLKVLWDAAGLPGRPKGRPRKAGSPRGHGCGLRWIG